MTYIDDGAAAVKRLAFDVRPHALAVVLRIAIFAPGNAVIIATCPPFVSCPTKTTPGAAPSCSASPSCFASAATKSVAHGFQKDSSRSGR